MHTPASIRNHPIHPMLVTIPIGLWIFSLACDVIGLRTVHPDLWFVVALYTMIGGILGALAAAIVGLIDLLSLRNPPLRRIALIHMTLNLVIVVLYVINVWLRISNPTQTTAPLVMSVVAVAMLLVSGWLGGELVHVHGVGVAPAARGEKP
ncbi:MAG: DUF2231 domain-containing protein [Betaproteobacteria bacterium]